MGTISQSNKRLPQKQSMATPLIFFYGDSDQQFLRVHLPEKPRLSPRSLLPVVLILHGGFWKNKWTIDNAGHTSLAPSLLEPVADGSFATGAYAAIEVEYRRRDHPGGGYPGTQEDVISALAFLRTLAEGLSLDLERIVIVGHSAGGMLALWVAEEAARRYEITAKVNLGHAATRRGESEMICNNREEAARDEHVYA